MAMARAEMSPAAVPASTAGNEISRAHATIDQEISAKALAEELKTLTDALFQIAGVADGDQPQVSSIEEGNTSAQEDADLLAAGYCERPGDYIQDGLLHGCCR